MNYSTLQKWLFHVLWSVSSMKDKILKSWSLWIVTFSTWVLVRIHVADVLFLSASHHISLPFSASSDVHHPGALLSTHLLIFRPSSRVLCSLSKLQCTPLCPCVTCWDEPACLLLSTANKALCFLMYFFYLCYTKLCLWPYSLLY